MGRQFGLFHMRYVAHDSIIDKQYDRNNRQRSIFEEYHTMSFRRKRVIWPLAAGMGGAFVLTLVYLGIVSVAESFQHAIQLFWQDRWIVLPIILGFGVQAALYTILRMRLFVPVESIGPSGKLMGMGGATSTVAMVACCIHHVTDALPILGLTAASTFLAKYQTAFMLLGLGTTLVGILIILIILLRERRKALQQLPIAMEAL